MKNVNFSVLHALQRFRASKLCCILRTIYLLHFSQLPYNEIIR